MIYQIKQFTLALTGKTVKHIIKNENGILWTIPQNPDNTDYQEYLKWIKEGGEVIDNPPSDTLSSDTSNDTSNE